MPERGYKYKIHKEPVFLEGCDEISFILVPIARGVIGILYALVDEKIKQSHTQLYEEATQMGIINGEAEPVSGGLLDRYTLDFIRGSIHYGMPEDKAVEQLRKFLHREHYDSGCQ